MDIQKMVDAMNEAGKHERSKYHLTLGQLIDFLEEVENQDQSVVFDDGGSPRYPHSYRGYYSDLAFEDGHEKTVLEVLQVAKGVLDTELTGYKGGQFLMDERTPLWREERGTGNGEPILDIEETDGKVTLKLGESEW